MDQAGYLELLLKHDDPVNAEWPGGWNKDAYDAAQKRFSAFAEDVQAVLGRRCVVESGTLIQDASFLGQGVLPPEYFRDGVKSFAPIRVSNFGGFATVYGDEETVEPPCLDRIKAVIERHDYTYIPPDVLWEPYTGAFPDSIRDWGIRYFDWL